VRRRSRPPPSPFVRRCESTRRRGGPDEATKPLRDSAPWVPVFARDQRCRHPTREEPNRPRRVLGHALELGEERVVHCHAQGPLTGQGQPCERLRGGRAPGRGDPSLPGGVDRIRRAAIAWNDRMHVLPIRSQECEDVESDRDQHRRRDGHHSATIARGGCRERTGNLLAVNLGSSRFDRRPNLRAKNRRWVTTRSTRCASQHLLQPLFGSISHVPAFLHWGTSRGRATLESSRTGSRCRTNRARARKSITRTATVERPRIAPISDIVRSSA